MTYKKYRKENVIYITIVDDKNLIVELAVSTINTHNKCFICKKDVEKLYVRIVADNKIIYAHLNCLENLTKNIRNTYEIYKPKLIFDVLNDEDD